MNTLFKNGHMRNLILVIVLVFVFVSCSKSGYYKTMSFLFDGAPSYTKDSVNLVHNDSIVILDSIQLDLTAKPAAKAVVMHYPYKEKSCTVCHNEENYGKLSQDIPDLCYTCHDNFNTKYKVLHAPVEGGMCTSCHHPHQSVNQKLLLEEGQTLCFGCHDKETLLATDMHSSIGETICTECHNPHGGDDHIMIK